MKKDFGFLLILALLQFGCASSGFNRGDLKSQVGVAKPVYDDAEIKKAFSKNANLPKPFKLGVYFKVPAKAKKAGDWTWTEQDKAMLAEVGQELKSEGIVSEFFPILNSLVSDEDLKSLRLVAAQHKADAILVINGAGQIDRYLNNWGWTYVLLLPTLFVSGSEVDTLFMTNASLWDVRNGYLYLAAEAEGTSKETYAALFGKKDKELINLAKTESLKNLKSEIKKMIKGTKL